MEATLPVGYDYLFLAVPLALALVYAVWNSWRDSRIHAPGLRDSHKPVSGRLADVERLAARAAAKRAVRGRVVAVAREEGVGDDAA